MTRLNKKSDVYYIDKAIIFKPLGIAKVDLIDDDAHEFIATIEATHVHKGWNDPKDIKVIAYEPYNREKWEDMERFIEYERAIII